MVEFGFMNDRISSGEFFFTKSGMVTNLTQLILFLGICYLLYRIARELQKK